MRHWWHTYVPRLKWPVQASVFVAHFVHHTLAFVVWASLILHVAIPAVGAGLNIRQISQATRKFLSDGQVSWPVVIALALIPAVLVALRQAYLSWEGLRERLEVRGYAPTSSVFWFKWPVRTCRFVATLLQQTAGFCGWIWIFFALIGNLGEAGSHVSTLRKVSLEYLRMWRSRLGLPDHHCRSPGSTVRPMGGKARLSPASRDGVGALPQARRAPSANSLNSSNALQIYRLAAVSPPGIRWSWPRPGCLATTAVVALGASTSAS
jgi:hypothetical protein